MQTAAVFNLLRWQSGCLESCVGIVISPTCIHQNESVPGQERFRFGLLSRTFVKAPNAALKRCPYLHHRHNHEHSPYTAQSTLILSKHDRPCCHTVRLHTRHRRAGCRLSTCRCHIHHYHCHRWRLFGTPCLSFHWRPLHTCCVRLYQVDLLSEWAVEIGFESIECRPRHPSHDTGERNPSPLTRIAQPSVGAQQWHGGGSGEWSRWRQGG